ncbi:HIT domain-containing protein [Candidatus Omnitrophota bacterium]
MNKLWAPWRIGYVQKKQKGCLFCRVKNSKKDSRNYIVRRSAFSFSILNVFPYNNGHVMVVPYRHVKYLDALRENELKDLMQLLLSTKKNLNSILKPQGFNIGVNEGRCAGAGFVNHVHIHIVPRWNGDANFMPAASGAKVISQSLNDLYRRLMK